MPPRHLARMPTLGLMGDHGMMPGLGVRMDDRRRDVGRNVRLRPEQQDFGPDDYVTGGHQAEQRPGFQRLDGRDRLPTT